MSGKDRKGDLPIDVTVLVEPGSLSPAEVERVRKKLTTAVYEAARSIVEGLDNLPPGLDSSQRGWIIKMGKPQGKDNILPFKPKIAGDTKGEPK